MLLSITGGLYMKGDRKTLTPEDQFATLAITCYDEQLTKGKDYLYDRIQNADKEKYQIIGINHNKSRNKSHYHILVRMLDNSKKGTVSTVLKELGIEYRDKTDDDLLSKGALETCGYFSKYAVYLLHKTTEAIQGGKAPYDPDEYITNLSSEDISTVLAGYTPSKEALTASTRANIVDKARTAGYNLENFEDFIESFRIFGIGSTDDKKFRNSYISGINDRMYKNNRIMRFTIEVEYPEGISEASKKRIDDALCKAISVYRSSQCSHLPLRIDPFTEAILLYSDSDDKMYDYRDISCSRITELRIPITSTKSIWAGKVFIFTHPYIPRINPRIRIYTSKSDYFIFEHYKTNKDSFLCTIKNNKLICIEQPGYEYSEDEYNFILKEFKKLRDRFNEVLADSLNASNTLTIDLDELNL